MNNRETNYRTAFELKSLLGLLQIAGSNLKRSDRESRNTAILRKVVGKKCARHNSERYYGI